MQAAVEGSSDDNELHTPQVSSLTPNPLNQVQPNMDAAALDPQPQAEAPPVMDKTTPVIELSDSPSRSLGAADGDIFELLRQKVLSNRKAGEDLLRRMTT